MSNPSPIGIFNVDFSLIWNYVLPPKYRKPIWQAWGAVLMWCRNWLNEVRFGSYLLGSGTTPIYDPTAIYAPGDRAIYAIQAGAVYFGDNKVYEALIPIAASPTNAPAGTNVVPDTVPAWVVDSTTAQKWMATGNGGNPFLWVKVQDNFIGAGKRANFTAQRIIYEYALNKWFFTTFRQPVTLLRSDIYIDTNNIIYTTFFITPTTIYGGSGFITWDMEPTNEFITSSTFIPSRYDFTIYVPVAVYNALVSITIEAAVLVGNNSPKRDGIVRAFADRLCPAGAFYNIITY